MNRQSPLQILEGMTVTEAAAVHDYVQLAFGGQTGLSIYNDRYIVPETIDFRQLIGKTLASVLEDETSIVFTFRDGTRLVVDMHRQAYHGPEALQFNRQGQPPMIWN